MREKSAPFTISIMGEKSFVNFFCEKNALMHVGRHILPTVTISR